MLGMIRLGLIVSDGVVVFFREECLKMHITCVCNMKYL